MLTLPTDEELKLLAPDQKAKLLEELQTDLEGLGAEYATAKDTHAAAKSAHDTALTAWKEANKPLIQAVDAAKKREEELYEHLQRGAVIRRMLTGEPTWKAFQAAQGFTPKYDEATFRQWVLTEAPLTLQLGLVALNTKAVATWLNNRADGETGTLRQLEGAAPIPASMTRIFTGKVIGAELKLLVAQKTAAPVTPVPVPTPSAAPIAVPPTTAESDPALVALRADVQDEELPDCFNL